MKNNKLFLYNTITGKKEEFIPIKKDSVGIYTCGPTVYNYVHIGNLRTFLVEDILVKTLIYFGYKPLHIMNFTDVDDKTIKKSIAENKPLLELTGFYENAFFQDIDTLLFRRADHYPRATEFINQMIECISLLIEKGNAYITEDGSVYFSISSFPCYGDLSKINKEELIEGASERIINDEYQKENVADFVLWKAKKPEDGPVFWDSPWGEGRPGWHIECTVMSYYYLGNTFDIHCGGVDNKFPHHENEVAQSISSYGGEFAKFFIHIAHLKLKDTKMSKSLGNVIYLKDLIESGFSEKLVRFILLSSHYRQELVFSDQLIHQSRESLQRIWDFVSFLENKNTYTNNNVSHETLLLDTINSFNLALANDINVPQALGYIFNMIREYNKIREEISEDIKNKILSFFKDVDSIFNFIFPKIDSQELPEEIHKLLVQRNNARNSKQWQESDILRNKIVELGYRVKDTKEGQVCNKI